MASIIYGFEGLPEAQQPYEARFGRWLACDREQGEGYAIPTFADPLYYWESVPPIAHKQREAEQRARALCSMGEDVVIEYLAGRPYVGRRYVKGWMLFLRRKTLSCADSACAAREPAQPAAHPLVQQELFGEV